jgi:hypothetical protein
VAATKDSRQLDRAAAALPPEVVHPTVPAGLPERVAARLSAALGPDVTGVTIRPHAPEGGTIGGVLRAFATDVLPRLRHRPTPSAAS